MPDARVFTIPPDASFLATLVEAILDGRVLPALKEGGDPAALAEATIFLPTQRAAAAFREILASRGGRARLLPRVVPLGDAEDADFVPASAWPADPALDDDLRRPPLAPLERRLILARLVQRWALTLDRSAPGRPRLVPSGPGDALALAGDLATLMDSLATEGVPWEDLAGAVEAEYSQYFATTLEFVRIASEHWPEILRQRGASDPSRRRNAVILAEAQRLAAERPQAAIIAAGSTGSVPATATLLAAIARLPNGAVVLPGLDTGLDSEGWEAIAGDGEPEPSPAHGHPQAMLRRLLSDHLRVAREEVTILPAARPNRSRVTLLSEAMRPAETTDRWAASPAADRQQVAREGGAGIAVIEASDEREEALAAAIALRETLAEPGCTAILVTPHRGLAGRVAAELRRWNIEVADSAGLPVSDSSVGRLARLAADAAALDFHPASVLALLAHQDLRLGLDRAEVDRARAALEIGVLRGPLPLPGLDGLRRAFAQRRDGPKTRRGAAERRLSPQDWDRGADLLRRLDDAFAGFTAAAWAGESCDFVALAAAHARTLQALLAPPPGEVGPERPGEGAVLALFDEFAAGSLSDGTGQGLTGRFGEYPAFFSTLARERPLAPPLSASEPRVKILGLLEARLLGADRVVLGGLDEGIWPPATETDAFLNRPMRAKLGLSSPERRIGQTAHDFVQLLGHRDVVITRARKRESRPMVRSRFLERIKAFGGEANWAELVAAGERYRGFARALEQPERLPPLKPPEPRPGAAAFPRQLSVTEVEILVRDPYAIYARRILRLDALDPIAQPPGAADRGTLVHGVFGGFAADYPEALPANAAEILTQRAVDAFAEVQDAYPELYAQWWPRFLRVLPDYLDWEEERRRGLKAIHAECSGSLPIPLPDGTILTLRGRADRIEEGRDGSFSIIDFKTGTVPSNKVIYVGFSPQLTLEAAMLMRGAFRDMPAAQASPDLIYVKIGGTTEPLKPLPVKAPQGEGRSPAEIVRRDFDGLVRLSAAYVSDDAPYRSRPYAQYARRFSDYDHLARVKEWSLTSGSDEGGEGA